ncbi:hypothetical protein [Geodermatophilus amargosae]|uniref:hypothetical protein n=1 Tax=Geodermatophilus amargosae TaxID=1296565 RepID=UPI001587F27E|nr:hypothetical protein [Geodermatophilus amargosae]
MDIGAPGGLEDPCARRQLVRSRSASTEDLVHRWVRGPVTSGDEPPALTNLLERLPD